MEHTTLFASSRGFLKSCDHHNAQPQSSSPHIDSDLLNGHRAGGSIYVCTDALTHFADRFLAQLRHPFVLVSGDSDVPVSPAGIGESTVRRLLDSPLLIAWYAQNCATTAERLHPLPIGLDYHTMFERPGLWGLRQASPIAQEHQLIDLWARSHPVQQRFFGAYCNWAHALERGDRRQCAELIDRSVCFFEAPNVPRASSWARQAEFLFVVSPEGAGMDCHRTWEALALGCIPIVKRNPICRLLTDLPVMIVDDWSEVRRDRMEAFLREFPQKQFDYSTLLRDTWTRRLRGNHKDTALRLSHADFHAFMTRPAV
jgi:hypothetical protein